MRKHIVVIVLASVIVVILLLFGIGFSVRSEAKALVINPGGQISREVNESGLHWKWPGFQRVVQFDGRIRTLQQQPMTIGAEGKQTIIASFYVNWRITDARTFFERFSKEGTDAKSVIAYAEKMMQGWIKADATSVFGDYSLSKLVTLDANQFKLEELERGSATNPGILQKLREKVSPEDKVADKDQKGYGIEILDLGIRKLGIPDNITKDVFTRMKAERDREVNRLVAEGDSYAVSLKGDAKSKATIMKAEAQAKAKDIKGQGDAKAAEQYKKFLDHAALANFLRRLETLRTTLSDRTTIILDSKSPPYQLLTTGTELLIDKEAGSEE